MSSPNHPNETAILNKELTDDEDGTYTTMFIVPPKLSDGDFLMPFQFEVLKQKQYCIFGRYVADKDVIEFALAGQTGTNYKLSVSDGNSPYGWKVKRHGMTKTDPAMSGEKKNPGALDNLMNLVGQGQESDPDKAQIEAFAKEDLVTVPHGMMRASGRMGIMDAKQDCVGPWSFYGPSLPEYFCRCKVKVQIYSDDQDSAETTDTTTKGPVNLTTPSNEMPSLSQEDDSLVTRRGTSHLEQPAKNLNEQ